MAVGLEGLSYLNPVKGIRLAASAAGVCYQNRDDVVLIECCEGSTCAGVFTKNAFCAAPVVVARQHMQAASPRYLLINSGNANAGTGEQGMQAAKACCQAVAVASGCASEQVLPYSTGVIGEPLPVDRITDVIPGLVERLDEDSWNQAATAIMTTDTVAKGVSVQVMLDNKPVQITGIAKGSGMIRPDMATMLAYIATDAGIETDLLQQCLHEAVAHSFNRITVDGDTSTNDACMLLASGQSGVELSAGSDELAVFQQALNQLSATLAQTIIRDGEGATKFITVQVEQGNDTQECLDVAYTIAHSPLVKTALFASDPNWGRILAAVGRAGLNDLVLDDIQIDLGDVRIVEKGGRAASYTEEQGQAVMSQDEITITVRLGRGQVSDCVWTTDLSYDYVKINAEYRT